MAFKVTGGGEIVDADQNAYRRMGLIDQEIRIRDIVGYRRIYNIKKEKRGDKGKYWKDRKGEYFGITRAVE